ncbi:hypothetical protein [Moraxella oblonga]|uniref:hypothetical protein n=1 Tax=Moraxella oblonga TaxID=200413 RepID=UPI00083321E1|nr:hypothetical protein [Moraxella oblonga]
MNKYPIFKVTFLYTLIGGFIGGILLAISIFMGELDGISEIFEFIGSVIGFGLLGILFGGIPAGLTGYAISRFNLYKNIKKHYPIMALIGFILSAIYVVPLFALIDGIKSDEWNTVFTFMGAFGIIGAISAIITGFIVLPKYLNRVE